MHAILQRRDLLDKVDFPDRGKYRKWGNDGEVLSEARRLIAAYELKHFKALAKMDSGLAFALRTRNLHKQAFAPIEQEKKAEALRAIMKATEGFE